MCTGFYSPYKHMGISDILSVQDLMNEAEFVTAWLEVRIACLRMGMRKSDGPAAQWTRHYRMCWCSEKKRDLLVSLRSPHLHTLTNTWSCRLTGDAEAETTQFITQGVRALQISWSPLVPLLPRWHPLHHLHYSLHFVHPGQQSSAGVSFNFESCANSSFSFRLCFFVVVVCGFVGFFLPFVSWILVSFSFLPPPVLLF